MRLMPGATLALCWLLLSCSPGQGETAQITLTRPSEGAAAGTANPLHPVSGLEIIPVRINGRVFRVELARTSPEQARGLMFRTAMAPDEGMIFPMNPPRDASFWMKNTVIPLDIIFIGTDRRILNVAAETVPYSEASVISAGAVSAVLELNGGRAKQLGIGAGDRVDW